MRILIILVLILTITFSCKSQNNSSVSTNSDTIMISKDNLETKQNLSTDFKIFWIVFRKAIIEFDSLKLISLTKFPLKTIGNQEEDPQINIDKTIFVKVLNIYLNTKTVYIGDNKFVTNLDFIKNTENPEKNKRDYALTNNWVRIGDMEFKKINNEWKLFQFYIDTKKHKRLL